MEADDSYNCHFKIGNEILDIKSEKMVKPDEAEKIKVTVLYGDGDDSDTIIRVFEIEDSDSIKLFIGEHVGRFFDIQNYQASHLTGASTSSYYRRQVVEIEISYNGDYVTKNTILS